MKKIVFLLSFLSICVIGVSQTVKIKNDKTNSHVTYSMSHPMHDWSGTSKSVNSIILYDKASKTIKQAAAVVKIETFDSQNANRDSHMLEVLNTLKYPNVSFQSSKIDLNKKEVEGYLTFHNVKKKISFPFQYKQLSDKLVVSANFIVKMSDYDIESPSLMMISADDDIKMELEITYPLN